MLIHVLKFHVHMKIYNGDKFVIIHYLVGAANYQWATSYTKGQSYTKFEIVLANTL